MGISPSHASSVHLVRNLQMGRSTPQYHLVFDNFFETVFSDGEQEPSVWPDLVVFNSFANSFDDGDYRPELATEWLNPVKLEHRVAAQERECDRLVRGNSNAIMTTTSAKSKMTNVPMQSAPRVKVDAKTELNQTVEIKMEHPTVVNLSNDESPTPVPNPTTETQQTPTERRYPLRTRKPTKWLIEEEGFLLTPRCCVFMGRQLISKWWTTQTDYRYIVTLLTSVNTLGLKAAHPAIAQFPSALKATAKKDPNSLSFQEAMTGPYREEFLKAMRTKIHELESHNCWDVVSATDVPEGVKVLPVMWVFKIKCYPDGQVH
jgi:hypothetical protein